MRSTRELVEIHNIWGYVDFFFHLNLLPSYSLRSQGDNIYYENKPTAPWTNANCIHFWLVKSSCMSGPPESPLQDPCLPNSPPAQRRLFWNKLGKASIIFFLVDTVVKLWVVLQWLENTNFENWKKHFCWSKMLFQNFELNCNIP